MCVFVYGCENVYLNACSSQGHSLAVYDRNRDYSASVRPLQGVVSQCVCVCVYVSVYMCVCMCDVHVCVRVCEVSLLCVYVYV